MSTNTDDARPPEAQPGTPEDKKSTTDFDSAWKDVIEMLFEPFTAFFFPDVHQGIDFSKGIEILDGELRDIEPYGKVGKRYADELIKVYLKDGSVACVCVFIHIEVQGAREKIGVFPERAYVYNYRAYDRNIETGAKIISLAILTDEDLNYRPDEYRVSQWGFELRMKFPLVKIIDYKYDKELMKKLESSDNPMAMVVKVQLKSFELKKADDQTKSTVKYELARQCYVNRYGKEQTLILYRFIDWLIRLPEELDRKLTQDIKKLEEDYKMPYVSSWEKIFKKDGIKEGVAIGEARGITKGEAKGEMKSKLETAKRMMQDNLTIENIAKYTGLTKKEIQTLMH